MKAMSIADVAAELGKSTNWLYSNWRRLVAEKKLPPPVPEGEHPVWNAAQFYAVIDKPLTADQRATAAAFRAAVDAFHASKLVGVDDAAAAEWSQKLRSRFAKTELADEV